MPQARQHLNHSKAMIEATSVIWMLPGHTLPLRLRSLLAVNPIRQHSAESDNGVRALLPEICRDRR